MNLHLYSTVSGSRSAPHARHHASTADLNRPVFSFLRSHPGLLRWIFPVAVFLLILVYELVAARWVHRRIGYPYHVIAEILFFATLGPALAFSFARSFEHWLDERDTSDWQAQLLDRVRADARLSRQLNDDALQVLFSAGIVIETLKVTNPNLPPELKAQVEATESSLQNASRRLRQHLMQESNSF